MTDKNTLSAIRLLDNHYPDNRSAQMAFERHGFTQPTLDQMRQWRRRGRIPGDWLVRLLRVLEIDTGRPVRLSDGDRDQEAPTACRTKNPRSRRKPSTTGATASIFE